MPLLVLLLAICVPSISSLSLREVYCAINAYRATEHLPPLSIQPVVEKVATAHATFLGGQTKLSHNSGEAGTPQKRLDAAKFPWIVVSEIVTRIDRDTIDELLKAWKAQPDAVSALKNDKFKLMGAGIKIETKNTIVVDLAASADKEPPNLPTCTAKGGAEPVHKDAIEPIKKGAKEFAPAAAGDLTSVCELVNKERRVFNLKPLVEDPILQQVAKTQAVDISIQKKLTNLSTEKLSETQRLSRVDYPWETATELLNAGQTNQECMQGMMKNTPAKLALTADKYNKCGGAVHKDENGKVWMAVEVAKTNGEEDKYLDPKELCKGVNGVREKSKLPLLKYDDMLSMAAAIQALDAKKQGKETETGSDKSTPGERLKRMNYNWDSQTEFVVSKCKDEKAFLKALENDKYKKAISDFKGKFCGAGVAKEKNGEFWIVIQLANSSASKEPAKEPAKEAGKEAEGEAKGEAKAEDVKDGGICEKINQKREKDKLQPLTTNPVLSKLAGEYSVDASKKDKLALDKDDIGKRLDRLGYAWTVQTSAIAKACANEEACAAELYLGEKENFKRNSITMCGAGIHKDPKGVNWVTVVLADKASE